MVKGEQKKTYISVDEILKSTSGGYDIFRTYLGSVSKLMKRPWPGPKGTKDNHASWGVFPKGGVWFYKDKATEEAGTAIQFVQKHFGLTLHQAKDKICWDFGLGGGEEINANPVQVVWEKPEIQDKEYAHITFEDQIFKKHHHKFWNAAEVTEEHLRKLNYFAVKSLAINRKFIPIRDNEVVMAYYAPEEDGVKIYFPERPDMKFRTNIQDKYLWNFSLLEPCKNLIVQKSCKDLAVTTMISPHCTATESEGVHIFGSMEDGKWMPNEEVTGRINKVCKSPIIWYGSDPDGVRKCQEITKLNKYRYVNTPKNLLPDINDSFLYAKKFGLKGLEQFMKLKKLI